MKKRAPQIGDVYEVPTDAGLAYIQFTHLTPDDKFPLVRVLPGLYSSRPADMAPLVAKKELYFTFYALSFALKASQIRLVSNEPVPEWARRYPMMRRRWGAGKNGVFSWLIGPASTPGTPEGLRSMQHVQELTTDQKRISIDEFCSHEGLVTKIVQGWTPERHDESSRQAAAQRETRESAKPFIQGVAVPQEIQHYLYFQRKEDAEVAADRMRGAGRGNINVRRSANGKQWLVLMVVSASTQEREGPEGVRDTLEAIARELGGEYDGWAAKMVGADDSAPARAPGDTKPGL